MKYIQNVVYVHIYKTFKVYKHCHIFIHDNSLSARLVTVFRDQFEKPLPTDSISDHLSVQKIEKGATVEIYITEPQYFNKPNLRVCKFAFKEIMQHFKKRCLKKLVCSPMGCVRYKFSLKDFPANINESK